MGLAIITHLLIKSIIRKGSINDLINPFAGHHESTRKRLEQFEDKSAVIECEAKIKKDLNEYNEIKAKNGLSPSTNYSPLFNPPRPDADRVSEDRVVKNNFSFSAVSAG